MQINKIMLTVVAVIVLLGALAGAASARQLSTSETRLRATFARISITGGFGTTECEAALEGAFHERSISKTVGSLTGYINTVNILRCERGGATVLRETLPWHIRYRLFTGTLPRITSIGALVSGLAWNVREPVGIACLVTGEASITFNREAVTGAVESLSVSGNDTCSGIAGTLSGTTTNVGSSGGARITVTLI